MKYYIIAFLCYLTITCNAQKNQDSIEYQKYLQNIEGLKAFNEAHEAYLKLFNESNTYFCILNENHPDDGDHLLRIYFTNYEFHKKAFHQFLKNKYDCLSQSQRKYVENMLFAYLKETDAFFEDLVSVYRLKKFRAFFEKHIYGQTLGEIEKEFNQKGLLSTKTIKELKYRAVLANLGRKEQEVFLADLIKLLYFEIKKKKKVELYDQLFLDIIPQSIAKIYSLSSVTKTLYLLDDELSWEGTADEGNTNYAYHYFLHVIAKKLKHVKIDYTLPGQFNQNKESIKDEILEDRNIWRGYIIIEK